MSADSEEQGMALLAPLRQAPLAASSVDVDAAVRSGHQRRQRRRLAALGSAAITLAVIAASSFLVRPGPVVPPAAAVSTAPQDVTNFDPRHQTFTVAPSQGFRVAAVITSEIQQTVWLSGGKAGNVYVTLSEPGLPPAIGWQPDESHRLDAVNGRRAYRADCPNGPACSVVYWEWTPGAWASATADVAFSSTEGEAVARDHALAIATTFANATTQVENDLPVRTPHTVAAPAGTTLAAVMQRGKHRTDLIFAPPGAPIFEATSAIASGDVATVVVSLRDDLDLNRGAPDVVDGKPAEIDDTEVTIYGFAGAWSLRVTAQPQNLLGGRDQLLAFARTIGVVPQPDDRTTWITPQ
jgi:hypothetical protein